TSRSRTIAAEGVVPPSSVPPDIALAPTVPPVVGFTVAPPGTSESVAAMPSGMPDTCPLALSAGPVDVVGVALVPVEPVELDIAVGPVVAGPGARGAAPGWFDDGAE